MENIFTDFSTEMGTFKLIFLDLLIFYSIIRTYFVKKIGKNKLTKSRKGILEKFSLFFTALGMIFIPLICAVTILFDKFYFDLPLWIKIISSIIMALNLVFFYYIHKQLGKNWSVTLEIRKEHKLVKDGIYRYIRHPMYTQCWIWVLFQGLVLSNYFVAILGILSWSFLYFTRVKKEEKMMIEEFGEEYEKYMKETGRLFPKIKK